MLSSPTHCFTYRGQDQSLETSNYVLFNPLGRPGCAVMAGSCAANDSIGSQVACGLALEHFTKSLQQYFIENERTVGDEDYCLHALETAFRDANRNVYSFGHSLAAGGRMAAKFLALVYLKDSVGNGTFCAGRVGTGSAYLHRDGELFPFFEPSYSSQRETTENYLGANSLVSVDLANVPVEEGDTVYLFSDPLDGMGEHELRSLAAEMISPKVENPAVELTRFLYDVPTSVAFSFVLQVGKRGLFLPSEQRVELSRLAPD